jgi:hypothetical protein
MSEDAKAAIARMANPVPEGWDERLCWPEMWCVLTDLDCLWTLAPPFYEIKEAAEKVLSFWRTQRSYLREYKVVSLQWRWREEWRQREQRELPVWHQQDWWRASCDVWADHFVHRSEKDRSLLAYTADSKRGQRDIQTQIRPGRYLRQFFQAYLTEAQIKFFAEWQATGRIQTQFSDAEKFPLRFATTADEIERVYLGGPDSCMSHDASSYRTGGVHPVRVYAAGDLAIAYLENLSGLDRLARYPARSLIWPDKKVFGRVYPTDHCWSSDGYHTQRESLDMAEALTSRLLTLGYLRDGATSARTFQGARLCRMETARSRIVIMPYLDWHWCFTDHPEGGFCMTKEGDGAPATETNGLAIEEEAEPEYDWTCDRCGEGRMDDDDSAVVFSRWVPGRGARGEMTWCWGCYEYHSFHCEATENDYSEEDTDSVHVQGFGRVVVDWAEEHCYRSDYSGDWFDPERNSRVVMADGEIWSDEEFEEHGFTCEITDMAYPHEDVHPDYLGVWKGCTDRQIDKWRGKLDEAAD